MKNRTIYEVLDKVMEDYTYSIKKKGNQIDIFGEVYIERIDLKVMLEKTFCCGVLGKNRDKSLDDEVVEKNIAAFKEELRQKVASFIKLNADILTDDEVMIKKLSDDIKDLKKELDKKTRALERAEKRIQDLEAEKVTYPYNPWTTTGITWETQPDWITNPLIGDSPDSIKRTWPPESSPRATGDRDCPDFPPQSITGKPNIL